MALVKAFKAVRPIKELVDKVAALPYDVMDSDEAREIAKDNGYSFLHVDKAEIDLSKETYIYSPEVYEKAKANLYNMINDGTFTKEDKPKLYIYRLIMNGRSQTGVVGCTSIDDYINNVIKKHEYTRADKERDRINHVDKCNANTGPIFLTYRNVDEISDILAEYTERKPEYNFKADDGVSHIIWVIEEDEIIARLCDLFEKVKYLYIADGHHRTASAVKVGLMRREENKDYDGTEEFNFFLSILFSDDHLEIMDYNRVVKDLNGLSEDEFINKVSEKFFIEAVKEEGPFKPSKADEFGMYLNKKWYKLNAKPGTYDKNDPVAKLDVSVLQNNLLSPILGIDDPRTNDRIDFVGGIRGIKELERRVENGMKIAFSMYPTTTDELMHIADADKVMPPKSTWFEPKPRSGIFIHLLD